MGAVAALPATAAAVVAHAAGDLRIEDIAVPAPAPDEAVIEVAFGGICGSDLHYWLHGAAGESVLKAPMVLGHEIVGTVIRAAAEDILSVGQVMRKVTHVPERTISFQVVQTDGFVGWSFKFKGDWAGIEMMRLGVELKGNLKEESFGFDRT